MIQGAIDWLRANPALATLFAYLFSGVFTALFKPRTPEEYAAMPKWVAASLKLVAAIGFDPVKLVEALSTLLKVPGQGAPTTITNVLNASKEVGTDARNETNR